MLPPHGWLLPDMACHALMRYAMLARVNYDRQNETIKYEDEPDEVFNYKQLFLSIATIYGVAPENMIKYWRNIDMQFNAMGAQKIPDHLRFINTPSIKSN
jgi:hypothetical protein